VNATCEKCGGTFEEVLVADSPQGCCSYSLRKPCSSCQSIVSKADADDLTALREIEKDGLACWFSGNGFWHVAEDEDEPPAEKHATSTILSEALAAYRRKEKN
jgi:hypothetical protein